MQRGRQQVGHDGPAGEPVSAPEPMPLAEPAFDRLSPLVIAAQRAEPRAVEELLGLLSRPLLRAALALLGRDHPDVDDLVQDVLIDFVQALPAFRGECTVLHFAIRIAARKATTVRRRAVAVRGYLERFHGSETPLREPAPPPSPCASRGP